MYDPKRTSFVSLNFDLKTKKFFQNLSTLNVYSGSVISNKLDQNDLSLGDRTTIESIPPGSIVHSLAVSLKIRKYFLLVLQVLFVKLYKNRWIPVK